MRSLEGVTALEPEEFVRELCRAVGLDVEGYKVHFEAEERERPYVEAVARGARSLSARPAGAPQYLGDAMWARDFYLVEGLPRAVVLDRGEWTVLLDCVRPANASRRAAAEWLHVVKLYLVRALGCGVDSIAAWADHPRREVFVRVGVEPLRSDVRFEELPPCMQACTMLWRSR